MLNYCKDLIEQNLDYFLLAEESPLSSQKKKMRVNEDGLFENVENQSSESEDG